MKDTARPLQVTVDPAPGTIVVPCDDPNAAAIKVPVVRIPAHQSDSAAPPTTTPPATSAGAATSPMPPAADTPLPDDVAVLQAMIRELLDSLRKTQRDRDGLQERLHLLLHKLYGPKAERFDPNQPWLIPEMNPTLTTGADTPAADNSTDDDDAPDTNKTKTKGHGRKPLPKELPRQRVEYALTEAERMCPCCAIPCDKFGETVHEQLDYHPASLFVRQNVRFKYACTKCHDHITVAHVPICVVTKGLPGPGLLAQIAACKYADHLPLHRLERILGRHGVTLARSTMCDWMAHVATMLHPLVDLMATLVRQSKAVHTDATKMPYLDPTVPGKTLSGQMWDYVGDRDHPFNVFDFCIDHTAKGIDAFLKDKGYRGYLNADAINLYDHLFVGGGIIEVGCWAHGRRNFYDAKDSDPAHAHVALGRIRQLYAVETKARTLIAERALVGVEADLLRLQLRQQESLPIMDGFKQWLLDEQPKVLPKSLIGQAIAYALRHWTALTRYLNDGFLDIDNNIAELTLRHIAIGRKNWLFAGSARGRGRRRRCSVWPPAVSGTG